MTDDDRAVVVGIFHDPAWDPAFDEHVAELEAVDPRVEVVNEPYSEPSELRTGRGVPPWEHLRARAPELTEAQRAAFGRVEVALGLDLPFDLPDLAPNLRWVQGLGAGVAQLTTCGLEDADVALTTAAGVNATGIAEFVMARILGEYKRVRRLDEYQAQRQWQPAYGSEVAGLTLGLLGFGEINRRVAARARAFDMSVVALRQSGRPDDLADQVLGPGDLHELLARSDVVVAAVPESAETDGLMDAAAFAAMRPGSMFVNVGRGSLVDEGALAAALGEGRLGAAALDVTRVEPLPPASELWDAPNLYLSAHCASAPDRHFPNLYRLFTDNLGRYLRGDALRNLHSWDGG